MSQQPGFFPPWGVCVYISQTSTVLLGTDKPTLVQRIGRHNSVTHHSRNHVFTALQSSGGDLYTTASTVRNIRCLASHKKFAHGLGIMVFRWYLYDGLWCFFTVQWNLTADNKSLRVLPCNAIWYYGTCSRTLSKTCYTCFWAITIILMYYVNSVCM